MRVEEARRRVGLPALLAAGALFGATLELRAAQALPAGTLYDEPSRWTDDSGNRVALSDYRGRTVVLSMFYSNCSSTCMTTLGKLREIEAMFEQRGVDAEFVLVSYDSSFDTPRELARFRDKHGLSPAKWHLLTGPARSVKKLATRIGLGNYVDLGGHIAHSFRILVLDESGIARDGLDPWHAAVSRLFTPDRTAGAPARR